MSKVVNLKIKYWLKLNNWMLSVDRRRSRVKIM